MDYVTVHELRGKPSEIWHRAEAGEEFVVTRNGKPFALLVHTKPSEVEDRLRAIRLQALGDLVRCLQQQAVQSGAGRLTDEDIQVESDAMRRERRATAPVAAEPAPRRYAHRR